MYYFVTFAFLYVLELLKRTHADMQRWTFRLNETLLTTVHSFAKCPCYNQIKFSDCVFSDLLVRWRRRAWRAEWRLLWLLVTKILPFNESRHNGGVLRVASIRQDFHSVCAQLVSRCQTEKQWVTLSPAKSPYHHFPKTFALPEAFALFPLFQTSQFFLIFGLDPVCKRFGMRLKYESNEQHEASKVCGRKGRPFTPLPAPLLHGKKHKWGTEPAQPFSYLRPGLQWLTYEECGGLAQEILITPFLGSAKFP